MRMLSAIAPVAILTAGFALAPAASASPFDPAVVAADAVWVVHLDVAAALDSEIGHFLFENAEHFGADMDDLEEIHEFLHFDPFKEVFGVTAYGFDEPGDDYVVVITGSDAIADALAHASEEDDSPVERTRHGFEIDDDLDIYVFEGKHDNYYVFAEEKGMARDAIAVLKGRTSNLADADWGSLTAPDAHGVIGFAAIAGSMADLMDEGDLDDLDGIGPVKDFIVGASDFSLFVAENRGAFSVGLRFTAETERDAEGFEQILHGLVGMAQGLAAMNTDHEMDEEIESLVELLNGLQIDSEDRGVSIDLSYDVDDVIDLIQEADF